jgi:hypothetical protein
VLSGAGVLGISAAAVGGLASTANAETTTSAPEQKVPWAAATGRRIAVVVQATAGDVQVSGGVWFHLEGFPDGWQTAEGDYVAIAPSVESKNDLVARPLQQWVTIAAAPADLRPGKRIGAGGGPQVVTGTVVADDLKSAAQASIPLKVAVEERPSANRPARVFAVRKA